MPEPNVPQTGIACAACIAHLAPAEYQIVPETEARVVSEHLSECPDCRLFNDQLDTTRHVLAASSATQVPVDLATVLTDTRAQIPPGDLAQSIMRLYRIAAALDVDDADELVQQALADAVSNGTTLDPGELATALIRAAGEVRSEPIESLDEVAELRPLEYDPDSDTAELFYPSFYADGPDAGRFIDAPNAWGQVAHLLPEDEVETIDLFEVTDSAIGGLPDAEMRLITLVDIEGVSFEDAAHALRIDQEHAARALNDARIHVRGAIDNYVGHRRSTRMPTDGDASG